MDDQCSAIRHALLVPLCFLGLSELGVGPVWNVSGCSGGAIVVPSEEEEGGSTMPTLVICGGAAATPVDRTGDPHLAQWAQVDLTSEGYIC